jgi:hypothetical protein
MNRKTASNAMRDLAHIAADAAALEAEIADAYDADLGSRQFINPESSVSGGGISDPTGQLATGRNATAARSSLQEATKAIARAATEMGRARAAIRAAWDHADGQHALDPRPLGPPGISRAELASRRARVADERTRRIEALRRAG